MTAPAAEVALRLPQGWIEFDPRVPDLREELLRAVRDEWGGPPPPEAEEHVVRLLNPLIVEVRRLAATTNIILVGLFVRVISVDGAELPLVLTANVVLALSPSGAGMNLVGATLPAGWQLEPVDLPAGKGVRVTGDTEIANEEWEAPVQARAQRYFLPVPGSARLVSLSFLTPNLDLADNFAEVFDAVAASMEFS